MKKIIIAAVVASVLSGCNNDHFDGSEQSKPIVNPPPVTPVAPPTPDVKPDVVDPAVTLIKAEANKEEMYRVDFTLGSVNGTLLKGTKISVNFNDFNRVVVVEKDGSSPVVSGYIIPWMDGAGVTLSVGITTTYTDGVVKHTSGEYTTKKAPTSNDYKIMSTSESSNFDGSEILAHAWYAQSGEDKVQSVGSGYEANHTWVKDNNNDGIFGDTVDGIKDVSSSGWVANFNATKANIFNLSSKTTITKNGKIIDVLDKYIQVNSVVGWIEYDTDSANGNIIILNNGDVHLVYTDMTAPDKKNRVIDRVIGKVKTSLYLTSSNVQVFDAEDAIIILAGDRLFKIDKIIEGDIHSPVAIADVKLNSAPIEGKVSYFASGSSNQPRQHEAVKLTVMDDGTLQGWAQVLGDSWDSESMDDKYQTFDLKNIFPEKASSVSFIDGDELIGMGEEYGDKPELSALVTTVSNELFLVSFLDENGKLLKQPVIVKLGEVGTKKFVVFDRALYLINNKMELWATSLNVPVKDIKSSFIKVLPTAVRNIDTNNGVFVAESVDSNLYHIDSINKYSMSGLDVARQLTDPKNKVDGVEEPLHYGNSVYGTRSAMLSHAYILRMKGGVLKNLDTSIATGFNIGDSTTVKKTVTTNRMSVFLLSDGRYVLKTPKNNGEDNIAFGTDQKLVGDFRDWDMSNPDYFVSKPDAHIKSISSASESLVVQHEDDSLNYLTVKTADDLYKKQKDAGHIYMDKAYDIEASGDSIVLTHRNGFIDVIRESTPILGEYEYDDYGNQLVQPEFDGARINPLIPLDGV